MKLTRTCITLVSTIAWHAPARQPSCARTASRTKVSSHALMRSSASSGVLVRPSETSPASLNLRVR